MYDLRLSFTDKAAHLLEANYALLKVPFSLYSCGPAILQYSYTLMITFGFILGSIKIWDFGAGQCIKEKKGRQSDEDLSITGLVYSKLEDDRVIIASGWNNKIRILLVSKCQRSQH